MQQRPFRIPVPSSTVKLLIAINIVVFTATLLLVTKEFNPITFLGISADNIFDGFGLGLLRLVSSSFTHSLSDPFHLIFNMLALWIFGRLVESETSDRGLLHLYLVAGAAGGLGHILLSLIVGGDSPQIVAVGASGAVSGIMVYAACMLPHLRTILFGIELWVIVAVIVALDAYQAVMEYKFGVSDGTAHGGHLGGAAFGYLAFRRFRAFYVKLGYGSKDFVPAFSDWKRRRTQKTQVDEQHTLDRLLDKVHREGMGALSSAERRFLEKASKKRRDS